MTLYQAEKDVSYVVREIRQDEAVARRLQALGLNDGTRVSVINRKRRGAMIVKVRGTRLALGKQITAGIWVEEAGRQQEAGRDTG